MNLLGVVRISKQDLAEGYGLVIQESELIADAAANGYKLFSSRHIVEPATINFEERESFQQVITEAINLKKTGQCGGLSFSRCDRLSRQFDGALQIALDCRKHGLTLRFVRENQWLRPDDPPINFVMFILQAFGVHTQSSISFANLKAGQQRAAKEGKLPAGVGPGFLGYTLVNKHFKPNSFITVCDEVLARGYGGESINRITRDLQTRGIRTPSGKLITRSTVALILRKARRYAGIWDWAGQEIEGLIPPRFSIEKAQAILANLKHNRERSFGFGKRKWLTGRVFCGLCRTKYRLREHGCCECRRASPVEASPSCSSPRIRWYKLSDRVWNLLTANLMHSDMLLLAVEGKRKEWEQQKANIDRQVSDIEKQALRLQEKRRLYSWQHAEGIISDKELLGANKGIRGEVELLEKQVADLKQFLDKPAPPDPATLSKWLEWWSAIVATNYQDVSDDIKEKFAEAFDLSVTIFPGDSPQSYRLQLIANISLEIESIIESPDSLEMVLASPQWSLAAVMKAENAPVVFYHCPVVPS